MNQKNKNEFQEYPLAPEIIEALSLLGYQQPTKIQKAVIPLILAGKNVAARSQTGTGKTAAFAIPVCQQVIWEENAPQALVLEPTRELAVQVSNEFFQIGRRKRLKVPAVFGGFPIDKQIQTLRQKSHIVVGTPGRIMDHARRESMKFHQIRYLVIDEADLMLNMGFMEEVKEIIALLPQPCQTLLFSATLNEGVTGLIDEYLSDAELIMLEPDPENTGEIIHQVYRSEPEQKHEAFIRALINENPLNGMIFCGTREMVNVLYRKLRKEKVSCGMIHGELDQGDRIKTIEAFRDGRFRYLVATDVAARGVDFDNITHVFNYDFPTGRETFVHRAGRTGRNGKSGRVISLVTEDEIRMLKMVEEYAGLTLPIDELPAVTAEETKKFWTSQRTQGPLKVRKGAALNRSITRLSIGGGRKSKIRAADIVGAVCSLDNTTAEDIGIIDVRDSLTYVEILNNKGEYVLTALQDKTIKGKVRKIRKTRP